MFQSQDMLLSKNKLQLCWLQHNKCKTLDCLNGDNE